MTTIEWTQRTWNPVRGCSRVSPGCDNCYAMRQAHRFSGNCQPYEGLTTIRRGKVDWTGSVRFVPEMLEVPLQRRKPTTWFVNSTSDLFHESLTNEQVAAVFGVIAACPQHTFQILTKRPKRMREWFGGRRPLPNVWLGVSCEDQARADERIPHLLSTPAAVRFVSAEPLLGPVCFGRVPLEGGGAKAATPWRIDWVIVGGESGPGARPCDVEWIRSIVRECREAGTACFVKQLGAFPHRAHGGAGWAESSAYGQHWRWDDASSGRLAVFAQYDRKGADPSEWPEDLRVREMP